MHGLSIILAAAASIGGHASEPPTRAGGFVSSDDHVSVDTARDVLEAHGYSVAGFEIGAGYDELSGPGYAPLQISGAQEMLSGLEDAIGRLRHHGHHAQAHHVAQTGAALAKALRAAQKPGIGSVVEPPKVIGRRPLSTGLQAWAVGVTVFPLLPQQYFKPLRLIAVEATAGALYVQDALIAQKSQLAGSGAFPFAAYAPTSFDNSVGWDTIQPNQPVNLSVLNTTGAPVNGSLTIVGETAAQ